MFTIERAFIRFLVGGRGFDAGTSLQLLIDGKLEFFACGAGDRQLRPVAFDVSSFKGRRAQVVICDEGMWHDVRADEVVASDSPGKETRVFQPRSQCVPLDKEMDPAGMRYLVLPINNRAAMVQCLIEVDGKPVQDIAARLAVDEPVDFWGSYPLGDWTGRKLRLRSVEERALGRLHRAADGSVYFEQPTSNWKELSAEALARVAPAPVVPRGRSNEFLSRISLSADPRDMAELYREPGRPQLMFTPKRGFNMDPSGLFYDDGLYHIFYNANPVGLEQGNNQWGHATSPDLFHWTEQPIGIPPGLGCRVYSGNALVDHGNVSGLRDGAHPPILLFHSQDGRAATALAYSVDGGRTFQQYEKNPLFQTRHPWGHDPNAAKHCVIPSPPKREFTIHQLKDTVWTQVFAGALAEGGNELEPGWVGNFSAVKDDGIYQVRCGSLRSRAFTVHAGVYDVPMRSLFNYFTWARCGNTTKNCTGPCHLDDGNLVGVGHRDFSGGYHQSSDQRKWPWGLNLGLMGLVQFGGLQKPYWDQGSIAEEVRWGCDYYQKIVRDDGGMFDSVFIPLGWGPRDYYQSDPPAPALWNNIRHQAMAAEYFKDRDAAYAGKCRRTAERVWRYMTSDTRPKGKYVAPAMPPLGHNGINDWFAGFYEGSALDLAHRIGAAITLHRVTQDAALLEDAARCASQLMALQLATSACFWEGPDGDRLVSRRKLLDKWHDRHPPCRVDRRRAPTQRRRAVARHDQADGGSNDQAFPSQCVGSHPFGVPGAGCTGGSRQDKGDQSRRALPAGQRQGSLHRTEGENHRLQLSPLPLSHEHHGRGLVSEPGGRDYRGPDLPRRGPASARLGDGLQPV